MHSDDVRAAAKALWDAHAHQQFPPRLRGLEVEGVDPVMLDSDIAGCVASWIAQSSRLDVDCRSILMRSRDDLDRLLTGLEDDDECGYFRRLRELATLALADA
jgi:hypothetical protein